MEQNNAHHPKERRAANGLPQAQSRKILDISPQRSQTSRKTAPKKSIPDPIDINESILKDTSGDLYKPYTYAKPLKKTVHEHINELRKRALWCVLALIVGGTVGYRYQDAIIDLLVRPLGQQLFYSSPTGGLDFLIKICLFFGFLLAVPVIVYNLFKFLEPAIPQKVTYKVWQVMTISILLALSGAAFAYFVSLPAALYFLNNFNNEQISSLISAQEYFNFVILYIGGFAALFQMPLIFSFLNKITPMSPKTLIRKQRVVILMSFIVAAILTPTPDPVNQFLMAAPIIGLYQTSVGVVWQENHRSKKKRRSR